VRALVKVFLKKYINKPLENGYWRLYGSTLKNPKLPVNPRSFLFICKGNICRSVFAQVLATKMAGEKGIPEAVFDSAGLQVSRALPPPPEALIAAREFGVSLDSHRSKRISREMAGSFDMVIAMEAGQWEALKRLFPHRRDRFFLLSLFCEDGRNTRDRFSVYNIEDPFGEDVVRFRACYERIEKSLTGLFGQLNGEAENLEKEQRQYGGDTFY
jgi:protein-tyrosine phosphatase